MNMELMQPIRRLATWTTIQLLWIFEEEKEEKIALRCDFCIIRNEIHARFIHSPFPAISDPNE